MRKEHRTLLRRTLANFALLLGSMLVFVMLCEFMVFRFILKPADFEANAYENDVIRYAPNQTGTFRLMDEIEAPFSINANGWNSRHKYYKKARRDGVRRIAIVGDSYVHAREVPFDQSFAEKIEDDLNANGQATEIFRFGIKGAPLSQYLHMIRHEVLDYKPDIILVLLIHNDFDESFTKRTGRYTKSFLRLDVEEGIVRGEIPPVPYKPNIVDWLSQSATLGYLVHRQKVNIGIGYIGQLLFGGRGTRIDFDANINISKTEDLMEDIAGAMDFVFSDFSDIAAENQIPIALVMDGHRNRIYEGRATEPKSTLILQLNSLAALTAARHGLPFLDLHPAFLADWRANGERFNFENDGHWNLYGHRLVAEEIENFLTEGNFAQPTH